MDSEQTNNKWRKGLEEYERERRRMDNLDKEARQMAVIAGLTEDFVCVNYVDLTTDAYENTTIYRISETLSHLIPGWENERNSRERFRLFSTYAVYEPDREKFNERTSQSLVLLHLQSNPAYFVNFRIRKGDDVSYMQMKFTADYAADGMLKGLVIGIHSIDEEMKNEAQRAEQLVVISGLTEDFGCVNYVDLKTDAYENTTIYRVSDTLSSIIPGWREERIFAKRIQLFLQYAVYEADRETFGKETAKEVVLEHLKTQSAYFVNFRVKIGDVVSYNQMKFTADYAEDGALKGLIVGIHNIDEEMKHEAQRAEQQVVISGLTEDFGCVNYVDLKTDAYENTTIYRVSDTLSRLIPGWGNERNSRERFRLFSKYAVYEPDREKFNERTSQSLVLLHLKTDPAYFVNFRIRKGDDVSYTQMKFTADYAEDGTVKGLVVGIHSIDEVKRQEQQRAEYMTVIASLADDFEFVGIVDKNDGELTIYRASRVFANSLELSKDGKITDRQFIDFLKKMVADEDLEDFKSKITSDTILNALERDSVYKFEVRFLIDGQPEYYRIKFTRDSDNPDKVVVGLLNIDQQVRNEITIGEMEKELEYQGELREARDKAEASSKAKSAFLFNMSHHVHTPMNAIIGFTDIALKNIHDNDKVADSLQKIKSSSALLLSLLNDALEMSRGNGEVKITEEPVDLTSFIDGITLIGQTLAQDKNIVFKVETADLRDCQVYADTLHINQVLINLVTNAVKYTHEGGTISLKIEQKESEQEETGVYAITVVDTGIGMSKEFMEHIFENFSREDRWEVANQEGAGLGLAIANRLVKLMHGEIAVSSEKGKGSKFVVTLPLRLQKIEETSDKAEETSNEEPKTLDGKKILLVEDNELNREIACEILEDFGMVVDTAHNGAKAVEMVLKHGVHYYDAIIMDINMPVMNGYEAVKAIRSLPDDGQPVVIIALSANALEEDKQKSLEVGMNAHIPKPIKVAELVGTLQKFIL